MAKEKLKIVPQYIRNVTKSTMYAASDIVSDIMPSTSDFLSSNSDVFKAVSNDIRNYRSVVKQAKKMWDSSDSAKSVQSIKNNFLDDLKSGNFYNKTRETKINLQASGFGDLFDMSDFDINFSESDDMSQLTTADKVQVQTQLTTANTVKQSAISTLSAVDKVGRAVSSSMIKSAEYIAENQASLNTMNMVNTQNMFNQVNGALNDIANNVRGLFQYTQNITTYFNTTAKMYEAMNNRLNEISAFNKEFTEMQRNLYQEYTNKPNEADDKNSFMRNGFNILEYIKTVKTRGNDMYKNSLFGSSMNMMGDDSNFLQLLAGSPAKFMAKGVANKLVSKQLKNSMGNFDEIFSKIFESAFLKFSSDLKTKGEDNELFSTIYKLFGLDLGSREFTQTDKYVKGPVPFNGYADKAITEVIPTYLRKILAQLSRQPEMIYDYKSGKFKNESTLKREYENENDNTYSGINGTKNKVLSKLNNFKFNSSDKKTLDSDVSNFFKFLIDKGLFYNPDEMDIDKLQELGLSLNDRGSFSFINNAMKSLDKKDLLNMNREVINGIKIRKSTNADLNKELTAKGFSSLFNGSKSSETQPIGLEVKDDYGKSVFSYLRDIRTILLEGLMVYNVPVIGKKVKGFSGKANPEQRMSRYENEMIKVKQTSETFYEDEEKLKQEAEKRNQKYVSSLFNGSGMDDNEMVNFLKSNDVGSIGEDARKKTDAYGFLRKYKFFNDGESAINKLGGVAKDIASAPERVMISLLDSVSDNLIFLLYGSKNADGKPLVDRIMSKVDNMIQSITNWTESKLINPLRDVLFGERGFIPNLKKRLSPIIDKVKNSSSDVLGNISSKYFGNNVQNMSINEFYNTHLKSRMPKMGLGAGLGFAASLFTPLGLVGGTLMGGAIGLASTSNRVKDKLFGEIGADNKRKGGLIPRSVLNQIDGTLKPMGKGAGIGALVGLLTPLGIVGTTMLGGATGFVTNIKSVNETLFGKMVNGERDDSSALIKKEWYSKLKQKMPTLRKGAGLGILGSFFLPGGPIGGAILGMGAALGLQSEKVKSYLFGDINPDDPKHRRRGGMLGKMSAFLRLELVEPFKLFVRETMNKTTYFIRKNMINPFLESLDPLKKQFELMRKSVAEQMKAGWQSTKDFVGGMFNDHVAKPFGAVIKENLTDPLKKFFNNIFKSIGSMMGKIISAPFKGINNIAMGYMKDHKKSGDADYLDEWEQKKKDRDAKTEEDFRKKQVQIKADKHKQKLARRILEKGNYSTEAITKARQIQGLDSTDKVQDAIRNTTEKATEILQDLFGVAKDILSAVTGSVTDTVNGYQINKKFKSREAAARARHENLTDDVMYMGGDAQVVKINKKIEDNTSETNTILNKINNSIKGLKSGEGSSIGKIFGIGDADLPSHASGIDNVPDDDYVAKLHKGEMVLPAKTANWFRKMFGQKTESESSATGDINSSNSFVNSVGKKGILNAIYGKVSDIAEVIVDNKKDKKKGSVDSISKDTSIIREAVDGQLNSVGYHTEMIANILVDQFGPPSIMPKGLKSGVFHKIKGKFSGIINGVLGFIKKPFNLLTKPFKWMGSIINTVKGHIIAFGKSLMSIPKTIVKGAMGVIKETYGALKGVMSVVSTGIKSMIASIPSILGVIGSAVTEGIKTIGETSRALIKGVTTVTNQLIKSGMTLAGQFVELSAKAIPATIKALGWMAGKVKDSIIGLVSFINPFKGKSKNKVARNIKDVKHVGEVDLIKQVDVIKRIDTVGVLEKIEDNRLYSKLDGIISAINNGGINNFATGNMAFGNPFKGGKKNSQVALFGAKEAGEDAKKKNRIRDKLQLDAFKAQTGTFKLLNKAFGSKGVFTLLSTVLMGAAEWITGKLKKVKDFFMNEFSKTIGGFIEKALKGLGQSKLTNSASNSVNNRTATSTTTGGSPLLGGGSTVKNNNMTKTLIGGGGAAAPLLLGDGSDPKKKGFLQNMKSKLSGVKGKAGRNVGKFTPNLKSAGKAALLTAGISYLMGSSNGEGEQDTTQILEDSVASTAKMQAYSTVKNTVTGGNSLFGTVKNIVTGGGKNAADNIASSAAATATKEAASDSSIIKKIMTSKPMQKLLGSSVGKFASSIAEWLLSRLKGKIGASFFAKLAAKWAGIIGTGSISGGLIPALWYGGELINSVSKTNQMFQVSPNYKCSTLMRTIAGISGLISSNITFGLVPDSTIAQFIGSLVLSGDDVKSMEEGKQQLSNERDQYAAETGEDISLEDYNQKVNKSLAGKAWDGIKDGASWVGEKASDFGSWVGEKASDFGSWAGEKLSGAKDIAKDLWSKAGEGISTIKTNVNKGLEVADATLGTIFGLESDDGKPLKLSQWKDEKLKELGNWFGEKVNNAKEGAKKLWSTAKDGLSTAKENISSGLEITDKKIGSFLGLQDADGNPMKLSQWKDQAIDKAKEWFDSTVQNAKEGAQKIWSNAKEGFNQIGGNIQEGQTKLNNKLGSLFGFTDADGNPVSFTEGMGDKFEDGMEYVGKLASDAMTTAKSLFQSAKDKLGELWDKAKENASGKLSSLDKFFGGLFDDNDNENSDGTFTGYIKNKWGSLIGGIKSRMSSDDSAGNGGGFYLTQPRPIPGLGFGAGNGEDSGDSANGAVYFSQNDQRWSGKDYGTASIGASGCGPTSAAMLLSSVTGQTITPDMTAQWSVDHGYRIPGAGTSWDFFPAIGQAYGVNLSPTTDYDGALRNALANGQPAILSGKGATPFTGGGHLIMATGLTQDGKIIINDPVSKARSIPYDFGSVTSSMQQAWISDKTLTGGVSTAGATNGATSSDKEDDTDPFTKAIQQLGKYSVGYIQSAVSGEVFDPSKYEEQSTGTKGSSAAGMAVGTTDVAQGITANQKYFDQAAAKYGVDAGILEAIAMQESGGDVRAGYPDQPAWGLMQIENTLGDEFAQFGQQYEGVSYTLDDRLLPGRSIPFAANRLSSDLQHYNGDYIKAIQAYNFSRYSLDPLIRAFPDDWKSHRSEVGQYNGTGLAHYGDPQYIEHVLRYYKGNAISAGNGEIDNTPKWLKKMSAGNGGSFALTQPKPIDINKAVNNSGSSFSGQDTVLYQYQKTNNRLNDFITADNMISSGQGSYDKIDKIIELLSKMVDSSEEIASNTREIADKEFTVNNVTKDQPQQSQQNNQPTVTSNGVSSLRTASDSRGAGVMANAYSNAMDVARGRLF